MRQWIARWLLAVMVLPAAAAAQRPDGRITGKVFDAATGAPVAGARVELPGSELRVLTAVDGRFQLHPVPAGRHDLRVTLVGFVPTRVTEIGNASRRESVTSA